MKNLLDLFFNGNIEQSFIEDYQGKLENRQYQDLLNQYPDQLSLKMILEWLKQKGYIETFQEEIDSIKEECLYCSFIHGINHNERVLFWAYYLGLCSGIDAIAMRIVLDGAKYHDIGRVNDLLDPKHGARSALMIGDVVDDPIYQNKENLQLLKGIVELHSLPDKQAEIIMKKYEIQNKELFYVLFSILKDADGLDRVRLTFMKKRFSALNPNYLRLSYSKKLLQAAHELNEFYEKNRDLTKGGSYEKFIY